MKKKLLALGMLLAFTLALAGCEKKEENEPVETETYVEENEIQVVSHDTENIYFKIGIMEGEMTAGLERLMADAERGEAANQYRFYKYKEFYQFRYLLENNLLDLATISLEDALSLYQENPDLISLLAINSEREEGGYGVTVATKKFAGSYPYALQVFMEEMAYSSKEFTCIRGEEMRALVEAYLMGETGTEMEEEETEEIEETELPGDDFYYPLPEPIEETEESVAE